MGGVSVTRRGIIAAHTVHHASRTWTDGRHQAGGRTAHDYGRTVLHREPVRQINLRDPSGWAVALMVAGAFALGVML